MRPIRAKTSKGPATAAIASALLVAVVACQDNFPTALDDGQFPAEPLTIEVELPWSSFGSNLQVLGGYSSASVLPAPLIARAYGGTLEARTLIRFDTFPEQVRVNVDGQVLTDVDMTFIGGALTLGFDTLESIANGPATVEVGTLQQEWEVRTASWINAVDTVGDQRAWTDPGAGPVGSMVSQVWDPAVSDSVNFILDSTFLADWTGSDQIRGARLLTTTDGMRLRLNKARLRVSMRASLADTIIEDTVNVLERTFVYDPPPAAPTGVRVGGVPSWRTLMEVALPPLTGPPALCAAVGCPFTPKSGEVSYAALGFTSQATEPAFQPLDSLILDVRAVLSPSILPKSPLGVSQTGGVGSAVAPEAFGAGAGTFVEIPVTGFLRTLLAGPDAAGNQPPGMLALLSASEPSRLSFASFDGPGTPGEPVLRLILTVGPPQVLP